MSNAIKPLIYIQETSNKIYTTNSSL